MLIEVRLSESADSQDSSFHGFGGSFHGLGNFFHVSFFEVSPLLLHSSLKFQRKERRKGSIDAEQGDPRVRIRAKICIHGFSSAVTGFPWLKK
ncbi:hypothetical protein [Ramlibacter sp.]|uniref:hypothetical protein n=1 Tax=Ramlibacter sp. TaxID=1917967 RepID=UPI003D0D0070